MLTHTLNRKMYIFYVTNLMVRVCVHVCVCVCVLGGGGCYAWVKCRTQFPSKGLHIWPHVTLLSLSL